MFKYVVEALDAKDNLKDQIIVLREYRYRKGVRRYIDKLISHHQYLYEDRKDLLSKYILYCIVKYYYGLDAKEVKPPKGYEDFKLVEYYCPKFEYKYIPVTDKSFDELKVGDKFTIQAGAFQGIDAVINDIDLEKEELMVTVNIFGQETKINIGYLEIGEIKHERKKRTKN